MIYYLLDLYYFSFDILEFQHIYSLMYYKILDVQNILYDNLQEDKNLKDLHQEIRISFLNGLNGWILIYTHKIFK